MIADSTEHWDVVFPEGDGAVDCDVGVFFLEDGEFFYDFSVTEGVGLDEVVDESSWGVEFSVDENGADSEFSCRFEGEAFFLTARINKEDSFAYECRFFLHVNPARYS